MKTIVIEDQIQLRKSLVQQINAYGYGFKVLASAGSVTEGIGLIVRHQPELVILDIEIIEGTSFDILDALPNINFKIIFATAHGHFAIKAIKYSAFDYLLKPIDLDELYATLDKLTHQKVISDNYKEKFELLFNELKGVHNKKIGVSSLDSVTYIEIQDIIRLEAQRSYCKIVLQNGKVIMSSKNMAHYESLLPDNAFSKIHRSHIINIHAVEAVVKTDGGFVQLKNGDQVPISRRKKEDFLDFLNQQIS